MRLAVGRALLAAVLSLAACKGGPGRGGKGVSEACASDADCAAGLSCGSGQCVVPGAAAVCLPGQRFCDQGDVLVCDTSGLRATVVESCPNGCRDGACLPAACPEGARRCAAAGVELCSASAGGLGWRLETPCPLGCDGATLSCTALACRPLEVRCGSAPGVVQVCKADGSGFSDTQCAAGARCLDGACVAQVCTPGAASCDGNSAVLCDASGTGFAQRTPCALGCSAGVCAQASCSPGESRCSGGAVETCRPDGSGFSQGAACPGALGCLLLGPGRAGCAQPVCAPLTRRCDAAAGGVEVCSGDGSGWLAAGSCARGCTQGACNPEPSACAAGTLRCAGSAVQRCDGSGWSTVAQCLGACAPGGVCAQGSCAGPIALSAPLPACASTDCAPPADGASTLLVTAGPLVDLAGNPVPDGTLVTIAATGGAAPAAADADPQSPGVQVRAVGGRIDFAVRAPPDGARGADGLAHAMVTAQLGPAGSVCAGALPIDFGAPGNVAFLAEDFTTDALKDPATTTADWRTDLGVAESRALQFGDGADGPLVLAAGQVVDLSQTPRGAGLPAWAPSFRVLGVGDKLLQLDGSGAGLAAGDELILMELQGQGAASTAAAGAWELATVDTVSEGRVTLTAALTGTYGAAPGVPLAGEKVVAQRVPHFTDVTLAAGARLTTSAWDGRQGGVLALRASGAVSLGAGASISADALGFRPGLSSGPTLNQPGESFGGQPAAAAGPSARNQGGGGGGYGLCDPLHLDQLNTWYGAGGSHGSPGLSGSSAGVPAGALGAGRAACASTQGLPYGTPSLARLFLGSGSGTQQRNTQGPCSISSCPAESRGPGYNPGSPAALDYPAAFAAAGACGGSGQPACAPAFSFCAAETASYGAAYQTGGATACNTALNPTCAATFQQCGSLAAQFNGTSLTLAHASFSAALDAPCTSAACNDTASYCGVETKTWQQAWSANGAGACEAGSNAACAQTYANCSAFNHVFGADTCLAGTSCSPTFVANNCGHFTAGHPSAVRPCNGNAACLGTFASCGGNVASPAGNTAACVAACPSLGANYGSSCSKCGGCASWNGRYCYPGQTSNGLGCGSPSVCSYAYQSGVYSGSHPFFCSSCPSNTYAASSTGCGFAGIDCCCNWNEYYCYDGTAADGICPADGNGACNSCSICPGTAGTSCATNPAGAGCDATCQTSAGCQTNPGCSHNPGCSNNPGCSTNVGCKTNTGCNTCGGRTSWDGSFCDFTNPANACACPAPWQDVTQGGRGGGIALVFAAAVDLSAGGKISAGGGDPGVTGKAGFAGGSGGSLWLRTGRLKLAASGVQLDARGGRGGGDGRVRLERTAGDDPQSGGRVLPAPFVARFELPAVQSRSAAPAGRKVVSVALVASLDGPSTGAPLAQHFLSGDGAASFSPVTPGGAPVPFSGAGDLRYRILFSPRAGPAVARTTGLVWLLRLQ